MSNWNTKEGFDEVMQVEVPSFSNWRRFIKAGYAIFTIYNRNTGNRFTFKVVKCDNRNHLWFVFVLSGPSNENNYTYIGSIFSHHFRLTPRSRCTENSQSFRVFKWLNVYINAPTVDLPDPIEIYHEGRCGRCGRRLTVPESIKSGFGPECVNLMMKGK